ncbi:MAG: hypothetical protein Q4B28_08365 [bacterium]|nr:hypothetical protein [bacterium]
MLIDIVENYDENKKQYLLDLREKVILQISGQFDHKKILTFLGKVGILDIDETKKEVIIGVSNDFVLTQIKKTFNKGLKEAIQTVYNPQFSITYTVYTGFANQHHELLPDLKKLLNITEKKKTPAV